MTIRVASVWQALKQRVASARMATILQHQGQIFVADEVPDNPPVEGDVPWLRVVFQPIVPLVAEGHELRVKYIRFLFRTEHNNYSASGYSRHVALEAAQDEGFKLLYAFAPANTSSYRVLTTLECTRPPQSAPMWDPLRSLWVLTSEWTFEVISGSADQPV